MALGWTRTLVAIGDSHTYNDSFDVTAKQYFPGVLETLLRAQACPVRVRNLGISGNTSAQGVERIGAMTGYEIPDVAVIYLGTNDSNAGNQTTVASGASATVFTVQAGKGAVFKPGSWLKVNGVSGRVLSVATDTITLYSSLGFTPAASQAVIIDTQKNLELIGTTLQAAGVTRIVIVSQHYWNFTVGGDTPSAQAASQIPIRAAQAAAVATLGPTATLADTFDYMRTLIQSGAPYVFNGVSYTFTQGDNQWQGAANDTHLNALGEHIIGKVVFDAIQAKGWLGGLS